MIAEYCTNYSDKSAATTMGAKGSRTLKRIGGDYGHKSLHHYDNNVEQHGMYDLRIALYTV